jgi:hypothetical protein
MSSLLQLTTTILVAASTTVPSNNAYAGIIGRNDADDRYFQIARAHVDDYLSEGDNS